MTVRDVLTRAWQSARPTFSVRVGERRVKIPAVGGTGWILSWHAGWRAEVIGKLLERRRGLFLDVGANIGEALLDYLACDKRPGYVGFEPAMRNVELLNEIVQLNGLTDCRIVPAALTDRVGILQSGGDYAGSYSLDAVGPSLIGNDPIAVIRISEANPLALKGMRETVAVHLPYIICEAPADLCDIDVRGYSSHPLHDGAVLLMAAGGVFPA
jgi:FkbM family methyltransferase